MWSVEYFRGSDTSNKRCVLSCYLFISCIHFVAFGPQVSFTSCVSRAPEMSWVSKHFKHKHRANLSILNVSLIYPPIGVDYYYCYLTAYYTADFSNALLKPMHRRNCTMVHAKMQDVRALQTILHMNTRFGVEIKTASQAGHVLTHTKHTHGSASICQHHTNCTGVGKGSFCLIDRFFFFSCWAVTHCFVSLCRLFPDHTSSICWSSALHKKQKKTASTGDKNIYEICANGDSNRYTQTQTHTKSQDDMYIISWKWNN